MSTLRLTLITISILLATQRERLAACCVGDTRPPLKLEKYR